MNKSERISDVIFIITAIAVSFAFFIFLYFNLTFNAMQCVFMAMCLLVPSLIQIIFKIKIAPVMFLIYEGYLIAHFVLGEILGFYVNISHYDTFLHFTSSTLLSLLGYAIIHYYLDNKYMGVQILFAFMFGLTCEFFWEILEYGIDEFFATNMQRFIKDGVTLIGHEALKDTIKDMIVAVLGSIGFILLLNIKKIKVLKIVKIAK